MLSKINSFSFFPGLFLLLKCLVILSTYSCKKADPCPKTKEYTTYLKVDNKAFIPYKNNDTLVFINNSGNEVAHYVQRKTNFEHYSDMSSGDCQPAYVYHDEYDETVLYDSSKNQLIEILLYNYKGEAKFKMTINKIYYYSDPILYSPTILDSMKFKNTTFYEVYKVTGDVPKELYYTKKEGIVHVILPDYKTLTLVP